ncbi:NUDIX hydrolase [Jatrophihabitans sp. YIM 134969]
MSASPPAAPRDAATVVLLRDGRRGLQTWLLTRRTTLAFAAGMSVYPGGRVDDTDPDVPLARPDRAAEIAAAFGIDVCRAHGVLVAAARETFEETGVLLTVPTAPPDLDAVRTALEARETGFAAVLAEHGLEVDGDAFRPWARWLTPEAEPRRYDTFFFVAALPTGMQARDVTTESASATWVDVVAALSGDTVLMPPTQVTLEQLGRHPVVDDVLEAASGADLALVMPVLTTDGDGPVAHLPDGRQIALARRPSTRPDA